jgi:hypothetical protein
VFLGSDFKQRKGHILTAPLIACLPKKKKKIKKNKKLPA